MENQKTDPFGNIKGDEKKAEENNIEVDPFTIDLNDAEEAPSKVDRCLGWKSRC